MKSGVVLAGLSPHPPIIIPEVGRGEERNASSTVRAMESLGKRFASADYDSLVIITPHGLVLRDAVSIRGDATMEGDFGGFGARRVTFGVRNDLELVREIAAASKEDGFTTVLLDRRTMRSYTVDSRLDHGCLVPLYYMVKHGFSRPVVVVNIGYLPVLDLYRYGMAISRASERVGRRVAVLASGDLSHRLTPDAPAGYNPKGKLFDESLMGHLRDFDPKGILGIPEDLLQDAGECGMRPVAMMLGSIDNCRVRSEVLSYEGPFGVGYGVALIHPEGQGESRLKEILGDRERRLQDARENESYPVRLARTAVEHYVGTRKTLDPPGDVPEQFRSPAGVFVSIHEDGMLRGCIGTIGPTCPTAAQEIIQSAISAATGDPRFREVTAGELPFLDYSVDVLSDPQEISGEEDLDPKVYGVIVERGARRGLLLPDLPGIDSAREQVEIAKRKAGIRPSEEVRLYRFTVTRYH
ncbi:MAG: AmmeMemoRadiSam system protein A [Bacillota bacterium]